MGGGFQSSSGRAYIDSRYHCCSARWIASPTKRRVAQETMDCLVQARLQPRCPNLPSAWRHRKLGVGPWRWRWSCGPNQTVTWCRSHLRTRLRRFWRWPSFSSALIRGAHRGRDDQYSASCIWYTAAPIQDISMSNQRFWPVGRLIDGGGLE